MICSGFAQAINGVLRTDVGHFFNLGYLMAVVWQNLFRGENELAFSPGEAWIALLVYCSICLWLLMRKVRATCAGRGAVKIAMLRAMKPAKRSFAIRVWE